MVAVEYRHKHGSASGGERHPDLRLVASPGPRMRVPAMRCTSTELQQRPTASTKLEWTSAPEAAAMAMSGSKQWREKLKRHQLISFEETAAVLANSCAASYTRQMASSPPRPLTDLCLSRHGNGAFVIGRPKLYHPIAIGFGAMDTHRIPVK